MSKVNLVEDGSTAELTCLPRMIAQRPPHHAIGCWGVPIGTRNDVPLEEETRLRSTGTRQLLLYMFLARVRLGRLNMTSHLSTRAVKLISSIDDFLLHIIEAQHDAGKKTCASRIPKRPPLTKFQGMVTQAVQHG